MMSVAEFIFRSAVAVLGASGLVVAMMLRQSSRRTAAAGLAIAAAAIYFGGQAVLTSGAATLSALLFVAGQWIGHWRQWIYRSFFAVFKIIWVGIGLNAIYNIGAVFRGWKGFDIATTPWFFAEALFAVIVLNGVYIGKVLGPGIAAVVKTGEPPSEILVRRIAASGSVSFVSWYGWSMARKGLLEFWSMADLVAMWLGAIMILFGLVIISETLRRTIDAKRLGRTL